MEDQQNIKVLLVDDHKMIREGLRHALNKQKNLTVIGEASNGKEAIIFVQDNYPDVIIMDVDMPIMDGIEATKTILALTPNIKIIGLSLYDVSTVKESMLKAGASAYITKDEASEKLSDTIRKEGTSKSNHS